MRPDTSERTLTRSKDLAMVGSGAFSAIDRLPDGPRSGAGNGRACADQLSTLLAADIVVPNPAPEATGTRWRPTTILGDIGVVVALVGAAALSVVLTLGISQLTLGHADMDQPTTGPGPTPPAISAAYDLSNGHPATVVGQQVRDAQHVPANSTPNVATKPASG